MRCGTPLANDNVASDSLTPESKGLRVMSLLLIIILLVLLFGGGGAFYGSRAGWRGPQYGGLFGLILIVLLVLFLTGNLGGGPGLR